MKEKKLRIEDALNATTRCCGGRHCRRRRHRSYVNAIPAVRDADATRWRATRRPACQDRRQGSGGTSAPDRHQRRSGRLRDPREDQVTASKVGYGFDAYNEVYCDMIAAGIVDPTKVTRSALENAASVAAMVLTTESLVADLPEPPALLPQPVVTWAACTNNCLRTA